MNKELKALYTPLQSLNNIKDNYFQNQDGSKLEYTWFNIIETALKKYDYIDENKVYLVEKEKYIQDQKKLEALEIIKEKGCSYIEKSLIISCKNYEEYCIEMNSNRVYLSEYECEKAFKTQEEFDLLKEILCE